MHRPLHRTHVLTVVLLGGLLAGGPRVGPGAAHAITVGALAPDFSLVDVNGVSHSLGALRGNAVLLAFIGYG